MTIKAREIPPTGILQEWVARLGLRHQGVLLTAIRGCDTCPKEDPIKDIARMVRGVLLNTHCENPEDAKSFIDACSREEMARRFVFLARTGFDHYPLHYMLHLTHACQVIGYKHPRPLVREEFELFYRWMCKKFHMTPETEEQMDARLGADEETFRQSQ